MVKPNIDVETTTGANEGPVLTQGQELLLDCQSCPKTFEREIPLIKVTILLTKNCMVNLEPTNDDPSGLRY